MRLQLVLLGALNCALVLAASAEPVRLQDAVRQALINSPALAGAEAAIDRSLAGVDAAKSALGPKAGLQGQLGLSETDFTTDRISQEPMQIGVEAEWPVYTSGANGAALAAALSTSDAAQSGLAARREQLVFETLEAYANAWLAEKLLEVSDARIRTLKLRVEETTARFGQGLLTRTDTSLIASRLAIAEASHAASQAQLGVARARLERLTVIPGIDPLALPDAGTLTLPASFETALRDMLTTHPGLEAARQTADAAGHRLKEAEGRFGPKVSLSARAVTGEDMYFFFPDPITEAGAFVTVEMPLYTSGLKQAGKRDALAARHQASAQLREAELELTEALAASWGGVQARQIALIASKQAEAASALAAEGARKEYEAGLRTLVESLDAEDEYRMAQTGRMAAEIRLLIARARVLSLLTRLQSDLLEED